MYILSMIGLSSRELALFTSNLDKVVAYLDPGSGSFILQILLATLLASLLFMKSFWRKVISLFKKPSPLDQDEPPDAEKKDEQEK